MEKKLTLAALAFSVGFIGYALIKTDTVSLQAHTTNETKSMIASVGALDFANETKNNRTIIDVRTPEEYAEGHIAGAQNIDFYAGDFSDKISQLNKNTPYAIYCRSGNRSGQTLMFMESLGFTNVVDLQGGIGAWVSAGNTLCTNC